MNLIAEALVCAMYAGVFLGTWLLGRKSRAGWVALIVGTLFALLLNAYLGLVSGVGFGLVSLTLNVRGYLKWAADITKDDSP